MAKNVITVWIMGEAKSLIAALDATESKLGKLSIGLKGAAVGLLALGATREIGGFLKDSVKEADRLSDATERLTIQLGRLATPLETTAGSFIKIGASSQDMLELEANFADMATAAGLSDPAIASLAEQVAATATAASLLSDQDPATIVAALGKASQESIKPLMALGVSMTDAEVDARALAMTGKTAASALTDGERAAARLAIALEQLKPKLTAATQGTGDLEQSQRQLDASVEELQGKLGGPLSDALKSVVDFINDEVDAIPHAIAGYQALGHVAGELLTVHARLADVLRNVLGLLGDISRISPENTLRWLGEGGTGTRRDLGGTTEADITRAVRNNRERNGLGDSIGGF